MALRYLDTVFGAFLDTNTRADAAVFSAATYADAPFHARQFLYSFENDRYSAHVAKEAYVENDRVIVSLSSAWAAYVHRDWPAVAAARGAERTTGWHAVPPNAVDDMPRVARFAHEIGRRRVAVYYNPSRKRTDVILLSRTPADAPTVCISFYDLPPFHDDNQD